MSGVLPIISTVAGGLGAGLVQSSGILDAPDVAAPEIPMFAEDTGSSVDDEISGQLQRNRNLRRQAASRSRSLTNIQDNLITEDSLLRLLSEG